MTDTDILSLVHRADQLVTEIWSKAVDGTRIADMTARQYLVLDAIQTWPGDKHPSQTDLAKATGIDRSTMADLLRRLLAQDLITRKRMKEDARCYAVRLTQTGVARVIDGRRAAITTAAALRARMPGLEALIILPAVPAPAAKTTKRARAAAALAAAE